MMGLQPQFFLTPKMSFNFLLILTITDFTDNYVNWIPSENGSTPTIEKLEMKKKKNKD